MIDVIIRALARITNSRFFETERGFQGELVGRLRVSLPHGVWPGDLIVEQEYQKRIRDHRIRERPDVIIHRPARAAEDRRTGNHAVILLKRRGSRARAREDFVKAVIRESGQIIITHDRFGGENLRTALIRCPIR